MGGRVIEGGVAERERLNGEMVAGIAKLALNAADVEALLASDMGGSAA